jgi:hypothetical protein
MSAAVVVPVLAPPSEVVDSLTFRKRRREILASQRQTIDAAVTTCAVLATPVSSDDEGTIEHSRKCRRVSDFSGVDVLPDIPSFVMSGTVSLAHHVTTDIEKTSIAKKPQMKYDPEVPMTKEEASLWRREQRRKRNRESAAMSRQRQRDRIADLEVEVADWKIKVDSIMDRIKKLEDVSGIDSHTFVPSVPYAPEVADLDLIGLAADLEAAKAAIGTADPIPVSSKFVSPPVSPGHSMVASVDIQSVADAVVDQVLGGGVFEQEHSDNMISRLAVS